MKFGVKTYYDESFLDKFVDKSDFFEVQAIRGNDYSFLKKYSKEIFLHCEHCSFGVNIADSSKMKDNLEAVNFAKELADEINAKKIVIHPGHFENESCSIENTLNFLRENCDSRFMIENMPGFGFNDKSQRIGCTPEEMKFLIEETGLGFCFDINHAIEYSLSEGVDYWKVIGEFERMDPVHYHLSGEKIPEGISHIGFRNSNLDLKKFFSIIRDSAEITLEVGLDPKEVEYDLDVVRNS
jgi:deoxyribonuclease-4